METQTNKQKRLIKLIHTAKSKLQLDDETYRLMLQEETGKNSTTAMAVWELEKIVTRLKKSGFKVKKPALKAKRNISADDAQSKMIRGLWIELHQAGIVRDPSETALAHWVKRQTGVDALQWLTSAQASNVIEALKQWQQRKTI